MGWEGQSDQGENLSVKDKDEDEVEQGEDQGVLSEIQGGRSDRKCVKREVLGV